MRPQHFMQNRRELYAQFSFIIGLILFLIFSWCLMRYITCTSHLVHGARVRGTMVIQYFFTTTPATRDYRYSIFSCRRRSSPLSRQLFSLLSSVVHVFRTSHPGLGESHPSTASPGGLDGIEFTTPTYISETVDRVMPNVKSIPYMLLGH